jgi:Xaa-Pro aminopeptidase
MGRMISVGPPTEQFKKCWDVVVRAFDASVAMMKPGVTCQEVYKANNDVVEAGGMMGFEIIRLLVQDFTTGERLPHRLGRRRCPPPPVRSLLCRLLADHGIPTWCNCSEQGSCSIT